MSLKKIDTGVAKHIGSYSDAVEVGSGLRWLFSSGTPGMTKEGVLPEGIEAQTRVCWANIFEMLAAANMTPNDLVKVSTSLINKSDIALYAKTRKELLGDIKPCFMLSVIEEMVRPDILVEVEIVAAAK